MVTTTVFFPFVATQYHMPFGSDQIEGMEGVFSKTPHRQWRLALFFVWYIPLLLSPPFLLTYYAVADSPTLPRILDYSWVAFCTLVPLPFILFPNVYAWEGWSWTKCSALCSSPSSQDQGASPSFQPPPPPPPHSATIIRGKGLASLRNDEEDPPLSLSQTTTGYTSPDSIVSSSEHEVYTSYSSSSCSLQHEAQASSSLPSTSSSSEFVDSDSSDSSRLYGTQHPHPLAVPKLGSRLNLQSLRDPVVSSPRLERPAVVRGERERRQRRGGPLAATEQILFGSKLERSVVEYGRGRRKIENYHKTIFKASRSMELLYPQRPPPFRLQPWYARIRWANVGSLVSLFVFHLQLLVLPFGSDIPWQGQVANKYSQHAFEVLTVSPQDAAVTLNWICMGVNGLFTLIFLLVHAHFYIKVQDLFLESSASDEGGIPEAVRSFRVTTMMKWVFKPEPVTVLAILFAWTRNIASMSVCIHRDDLPSSDGRLWLQFDPSVECYQGFHFWYTLILIWFSLFTIPLILADALHVYFGDHLELEGLQNKYAPQAVVLERIVVLFLGALSVSWANLPSRRLWAFKATVCIGMILMALVRARDWKCLLRPDAPLVYGRSGVFLATSVAWVLILRMYLFMLALCSAVAAQVALALNDERSSFPTLVFAILMVISTLCFAGIGYWWRKLPTPFEHGLEDSPPVTFYQYRGGGWGLATMDVWSNESGSDDSSAASSGVVAKLSLHLKPQSLIEQRFASVHFPSLDVSLSHNNVYASSPAASTDTQFDASSNGSFTSVDETDLVELENVWPDPPVWT